MGRERRIGEPRVHNQQRGVHENCARTVDNTVQILEWGPRGQVMCAVHSSQPSIPDITTTMSTGDTNIVTRLHISRTLYISAALPLRCVVLDDFHRWPTAMSINDHSAVARPTNVTSVHSAPGAAASAAPQPSPHTTVSSSAIYGRMPAGVQQPGGHSRMAMVPAHPRDGVDAHSAFARPIIHSGRPRPMKTRTPASMSSVGGPSLPPHLLPPDLSAPHRPGAARAARRKAKKANRPFRLIWRLFKKHMCCCFRGAAYDDSEPELVLFDFRKPVTVQRGVKKAAFSITVHRAEG